MISTLVSNGSERNPFTRSMPSCSRTFASLRSNTPRILTPSAARTSSNRRIIVIFILSIPSASDWTTSTSENLSTTSPGRKSASPKIRRQLDVSVTFLRYSQASCTLFLKNASSISWSIFLVIIRMRILECSLMKPRPIGYPSKSRTSTMSPFSYAPKIEAISLSKIQAPPCFKARPSPFFSVTTALLKSFSSLKNNIVSHI